MPVSSDGVALGPVTGVQSRSGVWGRLVRSGEIWGRWYLDWFWFSDLPIEGSPTVIGITDDRMSAEIGDRVVATARFSEHAATDGNGAWIVSAHPARLLTRDQAITALTVAGLGESGYPDSHPLVLVKRVPSGDFIANQFGVRIVRRQPSVPVRFDALRLGRQPHFRRHRWHVGLPR